MSNFVKMKLKGPRILWKIFYDHNVIMAYPPITRWEVMKERLACKYLPSDYIDSFQKEVINLQQGSMTIDEYTHKFHELCIRCKTNETDSMMVTHYRERLHPNIKREIAMFVFAIFYEIACKARRIEQELCKQTGQRFCTQAGVFL